MLHVGGELAAVLPVLRLRVVGAQLNDHNIGLESLRILPCLFLHIGIVAFLKHGSSAYSEVLHDVSVAQFLLQLGRITENVAHEDARAISYGIADTGYANGIFPRRGQEGEPVVQIAEHLLMIAEALLHSKTMTTTRIGIQSTMVAYPMHSREIGHTIFEDRYDIIVICQKYSRWRG